MRALRGRSPTRIRDGERGSLTCGGGDRPRAREIQPPPLEPKHRERLSSKPASVHDGRRAARCGSFGLRDGDLLDGAGLRQAGDLPSGGGRGHMTPTVLLPRADRGRATGRRASFAELDRRAQGLAAPRVKPCLMASEQATLHAARTRRRAACGSLGVVTVMSAGPLGRPYANRRPELDRPYGAGTGTPCRRSSVPLKANRLRGARACSGRSAPGRPA